MATETFFKIAVTPTLGFLGSPNITHTQNGKIIRMKYPPIITSPKWTISSDYASIALSMDGRVLYALTRHTNDLHVFDAATGNQLKVIHTSIPQSRALNCWLESIVLSADGQYLFLASNVKFIYQWDIAQQTIIHTYDLVNVYDSCFDNVLGILGVSFDGRFLCYFDSWFDVVIINMITNTFKKAETNNFSMSAIWAHVQHSLQEQSWKMDFYDLVTHQ